MKMLYLLRHAEAEPFNNKPKDFDRILTANGKIQAFRRGEEFSEVWPDKGIVYFSTAERTRQTLEMFASPIIHGMEGWQWKPTHELYNAPREVYSKLIESTPDSFEHVLLIGHNPGITEALAWFTGKQDREMKTADLAIIELAVGHWAEVFQHGGYLIDLKST